MIRNASAVAFPLYACGTGASRDWVNRAIGTLIAEQTRSADTHLLEVTLNNAPGISLYLKDESSHPSGSLKHRLARSLFLYALCNGWIGPDTTIVEASSGSTAVSEAYFARLLHLPFIAIVPATTAREKIALIERQGGRCHRVADPRTIYAEAERVAAECGGHYMDQFTYAERVTDWRGNNNIAESIFDQLRLEPQPVPAWVVCGAGTGGTSATIGRFIRYRRLPTRLCVADPESSVFHQHYRDRSVTDQPCGIAGSIIEGIGRPRVEPSFIPDVIDSMLPVSDAQSIASMRIISQQLGRRCGGSTGTNIWACAQIIDHMMRRGETGSIVTIICDHGDRYADTYYSDDWLAQKGIDWDAPYRRLQDLFNEGPCLGESVPAEHSVASVSNASIASVSSTYERTFD
jgi:cysteine synthase A